jgi:hypothetical protein
MSTLTVTKSYDDTTALTEAQLDSMKSSLETFFNTTKITAGNIQTGSLDGGVVIQNSSITTAMMGSSAIEGDRFEASSLTSGKLITGIAVGKFATTNRVQNIATFTTSLSNSSSSTTASGTILSGTLSLSPTDFGTAPRTVIILLHKGYFSVGPYGAGVTNYPYKLDLTMTLTTPTEGAMVINDSFGFGASDSTTTLTNADFVIPPSMFMATFPTVTPSNTTITFSITATVSRKAIFEPSGSPVATALIM